MIVTSLILILSACFENMKKQSRYLPGGLCGYNNSVFMDSLLSWQNESFRRINRFIQVKVDTLSYTTPGFQFPYITMH